MMKLKIIFIFFITLAFNTGLSAQNGVDVIVLLDNSGSIDNTEYANMENTTNQIIDQVLSCKPSKNKVSVIEYAALDAGSPLIYIESDFTNNAVTAKNYSVRSSCCIGFYDDAHGSVGMIGKALDGVSDPGIMSPQKKLTRTPGNKLVVFLFTDAIRSGAYSSLVNYWQPGGLFDNYNAFKSARGAYFVVLKAGSGDFNESLAIYAAAAIASVGGSWTGSGPAEANAGDPQGSGVKPRSLFVGADFTLPADELADLVGEICSAGGPKISSVTGSQTICKDVAPASLTVTATGSGTLTYKWYSNATDSSSGGTVIAGATSSSYTPPTNVPGTVYYYAEVTDSNSSAVSQTVSVVVTICTCYKPAVTTGTILDTPAGISAFGRAGVNSSDWPKVRKGAWLALEANTKGFAINRIPTTAQVNAITNAEEGMIVYDIEAKCLKIYTTTDNGSTYSWKCFTTQACPD